MSDLYKYHFHDGNVSSDKDFFGYDTLSLKRWLVVLRHRLVTMVGVDFSCLLGSNFNGRLTHVIDLFTWHQKQKNLCLQYNKDVKYYFVPSLIESSVNIVKNFHWVKSKLYDVITNRNFFFFFTWQFHNEKKYDY